MTLSPLWVICVQKPLEQGPVQLVRQPEVSAPEVVSEAAMAQLLRYRLLFRHHVQHDFTRNRQVTFLQSLKSRVL